MTLNKTNLLKIDKDIIIEKNWLTGYIEAAVQILKNRGIGVTRIKMSYSKSKGFHLYIWINQQIDAHEANFLQFLLGDDCLRVGFNRARIESELTEWNKLFEETDRKLWEIYP